ncbi:hypothetical protein BZA05DRAFT_442822 [Tricharina praecox]|uniref:uncharacterized protein n=1 Tax=Tricharina praecox TaxID=43433 RepID=UPI00221EBE0E|nr:uncharacterized protein BZA05DRAFT_442822 [Tricharina praecox]KAI5855159.1 hypothetical protein BZA05DRAFT_442822 [Tricharina praecox]
MTPTPSDKDTLAPAAIGNEERQDYVVVPPQPWLNGIATSPGVVKQFVAVPYKLGYSVEHQVTGSETVRGIEFEIIPSFTLWKPSFALWDESSVHRRAPSANLKTPTVADYGIVRGSIIDLILTLRGGYAQSHEMAVGAGGTIKQGIWKDPHSPRLWNTGRAKLLIVQVLNATAFEAITGMPTSPTPIEYKTFLQQWLAVSIPESFSESSAVTRGHS